MVVFEGSAGHLELPIRKEGGKPIQGAGTERDELPAVARSPGAMTDRVTP